MQLNSTLFGICIIQIKPQLERLLELNPDDLTKELKLTQDLMSLFMEYQIPSDLLSYDEHARKETTNGVGFVTKQVAAMKVKNFS